jgi:hypothetical protein
MLAVRAQKGDQVGVVSVVAVKEEEIVCPSLAGRQR